MQITLKQYKIIRLILVFLLAFMFSQAIIFKNFFLPVIFLVVASLLLIYLRKQVKEIIADERDYELARKAAFLAMQIYSWIAVVLMFLFYALSDANSYYYPVAMTLAFSTCGLMLLQSFIFRFLNKK
jgi:uncharacterized membrane protein